MLMGYMFTENKLDSVRIVVIFLKNQNKRRHIDKWNRTPPPPLKKQQQNLPNMYLIGGTKLARAIRKTDWLIFFGVIDYFISHQNQIPNPPN